MSLTFIALFILLLLVVASLPSWPYSAGWGYAPSGAMGVVAVVLIVMLLLGYL